jgi:hypothetical protein
MASSSLPLFYPSESGAKVPLRGQIHETRGYGTRKIGIGAGDSEDGPYDNDQGCEDVDQILFQGFKFLQVCQPGK